MSVPDWIRVRFLGGPERVMHVTEYVDLPLTVLLGSRVEPSTRRDAIASRVQRRAGVA